MKNPHKLFFATGVREKREYRNPMPESVCASPNNACVFKFLVALTFFLMIGGVAKGQQEQVSGSVTIKNSGSTNSQGFSLIVNPDGSGRLEMAGGRRSPFSNLSSSKDFPSGVFDYAELKQAIESTPNLTQPAFCAKSESFGIYLTLTYNNITSSDITCLRGPEIEHLSRVIKKINNEANCYGFDDPNCQNFREILTTGIDSGIAGISRAFELDGRKIKMLKPVYAKLKIFKSDGSFIQEIETNSNFNIFALLQPGDYFMTDELAGLSHRSIGFFDMNNWQMPDKIKNRHGQYVKVISQKPYPETGEYPDRVEFTVTQHNFNTMGLYFDGYSLEK